MANIRSNGSRRLVSHISQSGLKRNWLEAALRRELTEKQRSVLIQYYFEGMTVSQIAAKNGVCKSTVSRTLRRGEERLRRCFYYWSGHQN